MSDLSMKTIPSMYRPAPFWSWNEKLEPQELRRQIREMHKAGLGGFFMHARGGLQTEYLSEEWMDCVKACLDEAEKLGMNAWLYDENGWPSGFGGGLVNGLGVRYQQKYLRHEIIDAAEAAGKENNIAFYTVEGAKLLGRELPAGTTGPVLRCFFEVNRYYVDNLDPEVVKEFIRVTHQHYYETLPIELQKSLRGIFTDEPQLSRNGLLWSLILEKEYEKAYGRNLLNELPLLFLKSPESAAVRVRFWSLCARLFTTNFMKQIRDWCDAHHWEITGHHVLEENCQSQLSSNGSIMAQYRYYNMPGVDHLCRSTPSAVAAVQVASSAAQFGQKQILTESFALTGWAAHFTGMRWIYQQQLAHGINFLCPHLEGYSLRGLRKRDYPASAFYHQPWWKDYNVFTDSVSRVGMLLAEGRQKVDVLVIHPESSAWKVYDGNEEYYLLNHYSRSMEAITQALDARIVAHHYADEYIVDEVGSVENDRFIIGKASYKFVIVPQISNFSAKIAKLLKEFNRNGGKIFVVRNQAEDGPITIDGVPADRLFRTWYEKLPSFSSEHAAVQAVVAQLHAQRPGVCITENGEPADDVLGAVREVTIDGRSGTYYFFAATSYRKASHLRIALPASGAEVEYLDAVTGKLSKVEGVEEKNGMLAFDYTLPAAGSISFFVAQKADLPSVRLADPFADPAVMLIRKNCKIKKYSGNMITLDRCSYRVDGGEWQSCDIIDLQARLLARKCDCDLDLEIEFFCDEDFDFGKPLQLAVETPDRFKFKLNGTPFEVKENGYLFDKAFHLIEFPKVKPGRNVISMSTRYTQLPSVYASIEAAKIFESEYNKLTFDSELESVYLFGDFSVRHHGCVEPMDRNAVRYDGTFTLGSPLTCEDVDMTDLVSSGLPFFSGTLVLEQFVEVTAEELRALKYLRCNLFGANSCKLKINGRDAGLCCWEPFAWNVEGLLTEGVNQLEFELTTSLRNMLGPHHLEEGECYVVTTLSFNREPNVIGRCPPPYNPGYCFVNFGIIDPELA